MTLIPPSQGTYTEANGGNTPQGGQVAQGNQSLIDSAMSALHSGQTLTPEVATAANSAFGTASAAAANNNTPATRQGFIDAVGIPQLQGNFDDLAQKLADYDKIVLQPQFEGSNPGTPALPAGFSPLTAITGVSMNSDQKLTPEESVYNSNPFYALQGQNTQRNNIVDLLGLLNDAISKEYNRGFREYSAKTSHINTTLDALDRILSQNTDLTMKKAEIENQRVLEGMRQAGENLRKGMDLGVIDPTTGLPYSGGDGQYQTPNDYADAFMGGYKKWGEIPDGMKRAVTKIVKDRGGTVEKVVDQYRIADTSASVLSDIWDQYKKLSEPEKRLPYSWAQTAGFLAPGKAAILTSFYTGIEEALRKSVVGGRVTQQEISWMRDAILPQPGDNEASAKNKIEALRQNIQRKMQNPDYVMGSQTDPLGSSLSGGQTGGNNTKSVNGVTYTKGGDGLWHKGK